MRASRTALLLLTVVACHRQTVVPTPSGAEVVINLPDQSNEAPIALRLFVVGDGGEPGPRHDAVFASVRTLIADTPVRAMLLMPGDLTYPKGLPADCSAALNRLQMDYLSAAPDLQIVVVPGNHDHGDPESGANPLIRDRDAYFDCTLQPTIAALEHWSPANCPCDPRWHDPSAPTNVGTWSLLASTPLRAGMTLVTYDSQAALANPEEVAHELERTLDNVPADRRVILMAHHPLVTYGPHGSGDKGEQDVGSARYQEYVRRFTQVVEPRASRFALLIFGHEHSLQYLPGSPPELISGAGSRTSPVKGLPPGVFAVGETPGFAVVDLLAAGGVDVTLLSSGKPHVEHIPAPLPAAPPR